MNITYKKWLELKVSHGYFPDQICEGIAAVPIGRSREIIKNYNLLLDQKKNIISFYIGIREDEETSFEDIVLGMPEMYFMLQVSDSNFFNYTEIPFASESQTLFFENKEKMNNQTQIHEESQAGVKDQLAIRSRYFSIKIADSVHSVAIKDPSGDTIFSVSSGSIATGLVTISMPEVASGLYELWLNDEINEKFLYIKNYESSMLGILRIVPEYLKTLHPFASHSLVFHARKVYWEYKIATTSSKTTIKKMKISDLGEVSFKDSKSAALANGQITKVFSSGAPIELKEQLDSNPLLSFEYSGNFSNEIHTTQLKLPNPQPNWLKSFKTSQNESHLLVSTIVYV